MSRILIFVGVSLVLAAGEPGLRTQFIGGTLPGVKPKSSVRIDFTATDALGVRFEKASLRIDYRKINTFEYGQTVSRRYAAAILISPVLLLSKARKQFVTIGFLDDAGAQQALVIRVEKGDIRSVLASLEARTGRRVEYTDDDARRSGS